MHQAHNENRSNHNTQQRQNVEYPAETFPAFTLWIKENLLGHSPDDSGRAKRLSAGRPIRHAISLRPDEPVPAALLNPV